MQEGFTFIGLLCHFSSTPLFTHVTLKGSELGSQTLERRFKKELIVTTLLQITRRFLRKRMDGVKGFATQLQLLKRYYEKVSFRHKWSSLKVNPNL